MKVIDLLNKIANGEEVPQKIRITNIDNRITRVYNFFYDEDDQEYKDNELFPLGARLMLDRVLNKKVEIIEEDKKIEKLFNCCMETDNQEIQFCIQNINDVANKINELIDEVNKLKGDKNEK